MLNNTLKQIEETKKEIEQKYQMSGLSDGLYGDYATDVAKSSIIKILEQLVEREKSKYIKGSATTVVDDEWNRSKFDTISYLQSEIANLSTNIDKE